jgi:hypothetical protein
MHPVLLVFAASAAMIVVFAIWTIFIQRRLDGPTATHAGLVALRLWLPGEIHTRPEAAAHRVRPSPRTVGADRRAGRVRRHRPLTPVTANPGALSR